MDLDTLIHKLGQNRVVQQIVTNEWEQCQQPATDVVRVVYDAVGSTEPYDDFIEKMRAFKCPCMRLTKLQKTELQEAFDEAQLPLSNTVLQYLASILKTNIVVAKAAGIWDATAEARTFVCATETFQTFETFKQSMIDDGIVVHEIVAKHMSVAELKRLAVAKGVDIKGLLKKQIIAVLLE